MLLHAKRPADGIIGDLVPVVLQEDEITGIKPDVLRGK